MTQEAIDEVIPQIGSTISWFLSRMEEDLPRNPHLTTQIQNKIDMLKDPNLASKIINQGLFAVDFVYSIDSRQIPIVAVFPMADMREGATNAIAKVKLTVPILENFMTLSLPRNRIHIWYGFAIGNAGGGGSLYMEDQQSYESRLTETMFPYEAVIYHELGHSYISHESLNQFLEIYVYNIINTGSLDVQDWIIYRTPENWPWFAAILDIYELIGHSAMSDAYRIIYSYNPPYGTPLSEECKQVFVDQAPENLKLQVAELADIIEY